MKQFISAGLFVVALALVGPVFAAETSEQYSSYRQLIHGSTEAYPYSYSGRMDLADDLSSRGYPEQAREVLKSLLEENPEDSDVELKLAFTELKLNNNESARNHFQNITESTPDYADAWYGLGIAYRKLSRPEDALNAVDEALKVSPDRADFHLARGHIKKSQGLFGEAIGDYTRAAELDPSGVELNQLIRGFEVSARDDSKPWLARLGHGVTNLKDNDNYWRYYTADLSYDGELAYVNLNFRRENRGDIWDSSLGFDAYFDLWDKSYGNVRYQRSPDHIFLAEHDVFLEYYHPFTDGWIGSVNYRLTKHELIEVDSYGGRIALYSGNWFSRLSGEFITFSDRGNSGVNSTLLVRNYYWENDDDYMQVYASAGNGIEPLVTGPTRRLLDSNSVGFFLRKFVTDRSGFDFRLDHTDPEQLSIRQTAEVGFFYRW